MCGIVGLSLNESRPALGGVVADMAATIVHRGPDSDGVYVSPSGAVGLGFRRLAIRDLDRRADQPMASASGRTNVVFNGEIYNTADLAARYCGHLGLRTTGDTEVLLEAFERHGADVFADLNGMFAAALHDRASDTLTLVRDRMGKKPLYLLEGDGWVAFASELRALKMFGLEPDPQQAAYFFHFGYLPSPHTFFQRTTQLQPGEAVEIRGGRIVQRQRFFDHTQLAWGRRDDCHLDELDRRVSAAVSLRTLSDVPLGAFLSGGIDSTLVAAQLKAAGHSSVPTFTVAFSDPRLNEAPHAARIADYLGLPHTTLHIDERQLPQMVTEFLDCYEQPYIDSSGLPSMLLCRAVREHVTVAISGDGGDEFFGGYARYDWYRQALRARRAPRWIRKWAAKLLPALDARRGHRIARLLEADDAAGLYAAVIRCWTAGPSAELLPDVADADTRPVQLVRDVFSRVDSDPLSQAACFDAAYYIPDDLQVKMDRAAMRVALEVRCPLLDRHVTEFGAALSPRAKYRHGKKSVLKALLTRHVPRELFARPKQGFGVPMSAWLRGPLREAARDALFQQSVRECGWLNVAAAERLWRRFEAGETQWAGPLWMLFVLARSISRHASRSPVIHREFQQRRAA